MIAGVYSGPGNVNITFGGKAVTLQSTNGRDLTSIDCQNSTSAFTFAAGETRSTVVDGARPAFAVPLLLSPALLLSAPCTSQVEGLVATAAAAEAAAAAGAAAAAAAGAAAAAVTAVAAAAAAAAVAAAAPAAAPAAAAVAAAAPAAAAAAAAAAEAGAAARATDQTLGQLRFPLLSAMPQ